MIGTMVRLRGGVLTLLIGLAAASAQAQELCEFVVTVCPKELEGDTLRVPEKVIAMGSRIHSCENVYSGNQTDDGPPSIMFVIDNSGSMSGLGNAMNDRMGSRFTVPLALIDEIYARAPDAEIGVAVFQNTLYFDHRDDSFFVQLPGNIDNVEHQSYIPLTKLNDTLADGKLGIEKLKQVMAIDTSRAPLFGDTAVRDYVHLKYVPQDASNLTLNTNINVGFEAAKEAFKTALYPPKRQVIIFLSDGEPRGSYQAGKDPFYFQQGLNVPATFTVYFTPDNTAPQSLLTMTRNIRANGYSVTNPKSELWTIQTSHDALLSLIMRNVVESVILGKPNAMTVTGVTVSDTSTTFVDSFFVFSERVPLQPVLTPISVSLSFSTTDQVSGATRDTTIRIQFFVRRDSAAPATAPPGIAYVCWPRPTLQLTHSGTPISVVGEDMSQLGIRFTTGDRLVTSVTTALGSSIDSEAVALTRAGAAWTGTFPRLTTDSATFRNGKYEHLSTDSVIVVYRNSLLPLDTVRLAVPYAPDSTIIPVTATLRDTSGDGHLDRIILTWTDTSAIRKDMPSVQQLIKTLRLILPDGTPVTLTAVSLVPDIENKTIEVILKENTGAKIETDWQKAEVTLTNVRMGVAGEAFRVIRILDGAGPVVERAVLLPRSIATGNDSIRVFFSEPVRCQTLTSGSPGDAFVYLDNGIPSNDALNRASFAVNCSTTYVSEAIIVVRGDDFTVSAWEDRIGFKPASPRVLDSAGVHPAANSRTAVIESAERTVVEVTTYPNPSSPNIEISPKIRQAYAGVVGNETHGTIIGIYTRIPLKPVSSGSQGVTYGNATIYDAVGNIVAEDLPVKAAVKPGTYGIYWDIRNRNTRLVGNGTYLALITATAMNDEKVSRRVKIGVRR